MAAVTLLNVCRAARHGHRMNGKLARLAQQEAGEVSTHKSDAVMGGAPQKDCQQKCTKSKKKKKKKKKLKRTGLHDSWHPYWQLHFRKLSIVRVLAVVRAVGFMCHISDIVNFLNTAAWWTGCLQLLKTGHLLEFSWSSWKFLAVKRQQTGPIVKIMLHPLCWESVNCNSYIYWVIRITVVSRFNWAVSLLVIGCYQLHWPSPFIITQPKAGTHFNVSWRVKSWVDLGTAVKVHNPCPRLCIAVAVVINTTSRRMLYISRGDKLLETVFGDVI